ncbi:hypothetical protein [Vineibacter terrae]|uniref:hypothetical protein n=1 Tax=Vineibacter terrae TaxID=2586908 RepID=UPI002E312DF1|nr:hypothetical protein [Vineibacter terrae]HEX2888777.1 hypothetical protein [Vineibacter terrae]
MARDRAWAVLAAAIAFGPAIAQAQDMKRCDQLAAYYDRYGGGRVSEGRMPVGRIERELGYDACRKGDFARGVRLLEEAIRKTGFNVPPA